MDSIIQFSSVVVAASAAIVGFFSYHHSKRKLLTQIITSQRIDWITTVRSLLSDFIDAYTDGKNLKKAHSIRSRIDLHLNLENPDHKILSRKLDYCIKTFGKNKSGKAALTYAAQTVLKYAWKRMKLETGIKPSREKRIQKQTYGKKRCARWAEQMALHKCQPFFP